HYFFYPTLFVSFYLTLLLYTLLYNFFLSITSKSRKELQKTFIILCYSQTPWLLTCIPVPSGIASIAAVIWISVLMFIGFKKAYGCSAKQSAAAVLFFVTTIIILYLSWMAFVIFSLGSFSGIHN